MKLTDVMANHILAGFDIPDFIRNWFPDWNPDGMVKCRWHDDKNASLHISSEGRAYCHGCRWTATNFIELYAKIEEKPYGLARKELYDQMVHAVPDSIIDAFMRSLHKCPDAKRYMENRGIFEELWREYDLGYDPHTQRITIPIYDQFGSCVNVRKAAFGNRTDSRNKMVNMKDRGEIRLYPEWKAVNEECLLLVEGEWDCLLARRFGLPAVTWTGGAVAWNHKWDWVLKNKVVYVLYDNDEAGRNGKLQAVRNLELLSSKPIQLSPLSSYGKDITDWWKKSPDLIVELSKICNNHHGKHVTNSVCPCCGRKYDN